MSWRTALYLLIVLLAVGAVATTAISDRAGPVIAAEGAQSAAKIDPAALPLAAHGSRVVLLVLGIGAVVVTYRRAWSNFRQKA